MKRCKETGKVRHRDRLDAQIVGARIARKGRDGARAYRCEFCGSWHLTGQAKRRG